MGETGRWGPQGEGPGGAPNACAGCWMQADGEQDWQGPGRLDLQGRRRAAARGLRLATDTRTRISLRCWWPVLTP